MDYQIVNLENDQMNSVYSFGHNSHQTDPNDLKFIPLESLSKLGYQNCPVPKLPRSARQRLLDQFWKKGHNLVHRNPNALKPVPKFQ